MAITAQELVHREVHYCVSSLISTLAKSHECFVPVTGFRFMDGAIDANVKDLSALANQAFELAAPAADYEEAARKAGWTLSETGNWEKSCNRPDPDFEKWFPSAEHVCAYLDVEPYNRKVYEHWVVSNWLADKLIEKGEKVDKAFAELILWARTSSEANIADDIVIQQIAAEYTYKATESK
jgi:hypothetical protein